jgi:hypothetical protein
MNLLIECYGMAAEFHDIPQPYKPELQSQIDASACR